MSPQQLCAVGQAPVDLGTRLDLRLAPAAEEAGAAPVFFHRVMQAVHDLNRRVGIASRIAVAFPGFDRGELGIERFGHQVALFGGEPLLRACLAHGLVLTLVAGGAVVGRPCVVPVDPAAPGTVAFCRSRAGENQQLGRLRRQIARNRRHGRPTAHLEQRLDQPAELARRAWRAKAAEQGTGFLQASRAGLRLTIEARHRSASIDDGGTTVSTYGLSSPHAPLYLPV